MRLAGWAHSQMVMTWQRIEPRVGSFKGHIKGSFRFGRGGRAKSPAVAVRTGGDTTTLDATAEEPEHAADDDEPDAPADKPTPERAPRRSRAAAMFGKRNSDG